MLASDSFDRANQALSTSANWTIFSGQLDCNIVSNQLQGNGALAAADFWSALTWPNDQWAQIPVITLNTDLNSYATVLLRAASSANTNYYIRAYGPMGASAVLAVEKTVAGVFTSIHQSTQTINSGDVLYGEVRGSTLIAKINGAIKDTQTDSAITSGSAGVGMEGSAVQADGVAAQWSAGDFVNIAPPFQRGPGKSPGKSPVSARFFRVTPAGPPPSVVANIIQQLLQLLGVGS